MRARKALWRDIGLLAGIMGLCTAVSVLLSRTAEDNNPFAAPLYILAVALVSRYTNGYFYGIAASLIGVVCVNYMFTYPFWEFDITLAGYPLTFTVMLVVSVLICTLSTRLKRQERLRFEAENEKMRANLLRSVSHDIRTPLTAILGASSALLESRDLPEPERDALLRGINTDARWLIHTTENLLSVTKFSAEGVKIAKTEEVVEEIVGSAIVKFHKNCALPVRVDKPDEILLAPMDATLIEQVLINVLENVVAHGERATRVEVTIARAPGRVEFALADDGAGIPANILPHLFDGRLAMGARPHGDDRRNMGIGLSVCQSIIRAHGGAMRAENNVSGGATIRFWLPCEGEEDEN